MIDSMDAALDYIFRTRRRLDETPRGLDQYTRDISTTRRLIDEESLLATAREYAVVTGSRGKGSVTAIMAKLLEALGHRVGTITSPHLVHWNERIRVNGRMIPTADFLRVTRELQPTIDTITATMRAAQYLSPQGIFLAIALRYFDENDVDIAVLEVGRGGRFDDISVVPNRLAVFAPIMLEHQALLGDTLERIAWHKAGIIREGANAISLPQAKGAAAELQREAAEQDANLTILSDADLARWVGDLPQGQRIYLPPYGKMDLPLLGRYQIENATLAIRAVELLLRSEGHAVHTAAVADAIGRGLDAVKWLGRVQKLDENPSIYVDGAITVASAQSFVDSVAIRLNEPVVSIVGIPRDRDYAAVYKVMAEVSRTLIITETDINPNTRFPSRQDALGAAQGLADDVRFAANLTSSLEVARDLAGNSGTILLAVSLMLVGECMLIWDVDTTAM